jgi:hypothetical protein
MCIEQSWYGQSASPLPDMRIYPKQTRLSTVYTNRM